MLKPSRIYSFIHQNNRFSFHLIDGQKIISDLAVMHNFNPSSLGYLRDTLLSSLLLERVIKIGETLGFYIDSETPYFKFKLELNFHGKFRTMILPKMLSHIPSHFTGVARLTKVMNTSAAPYTSIIEVKNETSADILNNVLKRSYQDESIIVLSDKSDQSLLISKLPQNSKDQDESFDHIGPQNFYDTHKNIFESFFNGHSNDLEEIVKYFEANGFHYLSSKVLEFECPCSREHYLASLNNLSDETKSELLQDEHIDITCDYCLKNYFYQKSEFTN